MVYNALQASGCGPVGRALDLGAGAPNRRQNYLSPKPVAALALFFLTSPLLWSKIAFDHMFDHFGRIPSTSYPGVAQLVGRLIWVQDAGSSNLPTRTMQSVLIGSEYPVMDTLLFYSPKSSYCNLFRGVAECYAFSCFHDNVGLRDLPAIRHIKGTDAVIVNTLRAEYEKTPFAL